MEIFSDAPHSNSAEVKRQLSAGRTPLQDVKNLAHSRFDNLSTPKRQQTTAQSRRSRALEAEVPPTSLSEPHINNPSSSSEAHLSRRSLQTLQEIDLGVDIVVGGFDEFEDTGQALPQSNMTEAHIGNEQVSADTTFDDTDTVESNVPVELWPSDHTYHQVTRVENRTVLGNAEDLTDTGLPLEPNNPRDPSSEQINKVSTETTVDQSNTLASGTPIEKLELSSHNYHLSVTENDIALDNAYEFVKKRLHLLQMAEQDLNDKQIIGDSVQTKDDFSIGVASSLSAEELYPCEDSYQFFAIDSEAPVKDSGSQLTEGPAKYHDGEQPQIVSAYAENSGPIGLILTESNESAQSQGVDVSTVTDPCERIDASMVTDSCGWANVSTKTDQCSYADVSMVTDAAVFSERSVLAVPDYASQETMTEKDSVDVASSMTPLKLGKHGLRLTAEEVRRQHPRVVANQIETVMVANQRLEKETKSFNRERNSLKSALKDSRTALHERASTISELESALQEKQQKLEQLEQLVMEERSKCWSAEEALQVGQAELQGRCHDLEKLRLQEQRAFAEEKIRAEAEDRSYKQKFETAQQKIRELLAKETEYAQLVEEMEKACRLQNHLKKAMMDLKNVAGNLAKSNTQLKNENENLKKRFVSKEVDLDLAKRENREILLDNEMMGSLLERSNNWVTELEAMLNTANADSTRLQDKLAEQTEENMALADANEDLRHSKALAVLQLSEQQDSETVALKALQECEDQLRDTQEALHREKNILAAGKAMHEKMKKSFEEKNLKLEKKVEHLEKILEVSELKCEAQEQELYECREEMSSLQDVETAFEESRQDVEAGVAGIKVVQDQMESLLLSLHRKVDFGGSRNKAMKMDSSTPKTIKQQQKQGNSFVAQILSQRGLNQPPPSDTSKSALLDVSGLCLLDQSTHARHRQQSNVEFGAPRPEFGAAADAMLSPHSHSLCCVPSMATRVYEPWATHHTGRSPDLSRKSLSFTEGSGSRRGLFLDEDKGVDHRLSCEVIEREQQRPDGISTMPGFATIKNIPSTVDRTLGVVNTSSDFAESERGDGPGKSLAINSAPVSEKVSALKRVFDQILQAVKLVERASQLTLRDAQEELEYVKEQLKREKQDRHDLQAEVENKSKSLNAMNVRQKELQTRVSDMTKSLLDFHDQSLQISRLEEEKRDLKWKVADLEGQSSLLSEHLEAVVRKLDAAMAGQAVSSDNNGGAELHDVWTLKRENHGLMLKLCREREEHQDLEQKAVKKMRILESNWQKAENEVKRLDELVQEVREGCVTSHAQSTHPLILNIVRFIDGRVPGLSG